MVVGGTASLRNKTNYCFCCIQKTVFVSILSSFRAALDRAAVLLKMSLGGLRMDNQWGAGGGQKPITQLIKEVN